MSSFSASKRGVSMLDIVKINSQLQKKAAELAKNPQQQEPTATGARGGTAAGTGAGAASHGHTVVHGASSTSLAGVGAGDAAVAPLSRHGSAGGGGMGAMGHGMTSAGSFHHHRGHAATTIGTGTGATTPSSLRSITEEKQVAGAVAPTAATTTSVGGSASGRALSSGGVSASGSTMSSLLLQAAANGAAASGGGGGGTPARGAVHSIGASNTGGATVLTAAVAVGDATGGPAAATATSIVGMGAASVLAKAAAKLKHNAERNTKGKYYLRMMPQDPEHPPIGIPVREFLTQIFHYKRDATMRDLLRYAVFVLTFTLVVLNIDATTEAFSTNTAVYNLFLDEELPAFSFKKNFFDISNFEELSDWMTGPLHAGLYPDTWYNGEPFAALRQGYVLFNLRLVQGARIWLSRVSNSTSCTEIQRVSSTYADRFRPPDGSCYGHLLPGKDEEMAPFGPPSDPTKYKYYANVGAKLIGKPGWGESSYGTGGYAVYLPSNGTEAQAILNGLIADRFFDERTRAVAFEFNLYNGNTDLLTVARFVVEVLPTGHFIPSYWIYSMRLALYAGFNDKFRTIGEVALVIMCLYYFAIEIRQLLLARPWYKYFLDISNFFDLLLQSLILVQIGYFITIVTDRGRRDFDANKPCTATTTVTPNAAGAITCFSDMFDYGQRYVYFISIAGVVLLMMLLKLFKFFGLSRKMNVLWLTLATAGESLIVFLFGFVLLVSGFALMGQLSFGATVGSFHTFESSFSTLLRYPLGDFDYTALADARPSVAPIFFTLYMALVYVVWLNMVVAIITIAFEQVHVNVKVQDKWKHTTSSYYAYLATRARRNYLVVKLWFRSTCGCIAACRPPKPKANAFAGRKSMKINGIEAQIDKDPIQAEVAALTAEQQYCDLMATFIWRSERFSRSDLMQYMEDIQRTRDHGQSLYVGLNELCNLCRDPEQPLDPFCAVGHRWRALSSFVASKAREAEDEGFDASSYKCCGLRTDKGMLGAALACVPRCCLGRARLVKDVSPLTAGDAGIELPEASTPSGPGSGNVSTRSGLASAGQSARTWTSNPLQAGRAGPGGKGGDGSGSGGAEAPAVEELPVEVLMEVYKPKCVAWRMVQAYNAHKDVIMLGASERHAFMNERTMTLVAEAANASKGASTTVGGLVGSWQVVKVNRSQVKQRRWISIKQEGPGHYHMIYNYDLSGRLKRRFPLNSVVQIEASILNPRRVYLYIEPDLVVDAKERAADAAAQYDVTADTIYDLLFQAASERDDFLNHIMRLRELALKAAEPSNDVLLRTLAGAATGGGASERKKRGTVQTQAASAASGNAGGQALLGKLALLLRDKSQKDMAAAAGGGGGGGGTATDAAGKTVANPMRGAGGDAASGNTTDAEGSGSLDDDGAGSDDEGSAPVVFRQATGGQLKRLVSVAKMNIAAARLTRISSTSTSGGSGGGARDDDDDDDHDDGGGAAGGHDDEAFDDRFDADGDDSGGGGGGGAAPSPASTSRSSNIKSVPPPSSSSSAAASPKLDLSSRLRRSTMRGLPGLSLGSRQSSVQSTQGDDVATVTVAPPAGLAAAAAAAAAPASPPASTSRGSTSRAFSPLAALGRTPSARGRS